MPITKVNGKIEIEKTSLKFLDKKLQYLSNKNGFLGIDNKFNFKEKVIIIPFGLEKTVSYGAGTKNGPNIIIKASNTK
jgi:agmatinase